MTPVEVERDDDGTVRVRVDRAGERAVSDVLTDPVAHIQQVAQAAGYGGVSVMPPAGEPEPEPPDPADSGEPVPPPEGDPDVPPPEEPEAPEAPAEQQP